jgi:hypothetical protein
MLKRKLQVAGVILLVLAILVPAYISFVSSSTGYIRINGTSASVPGQQVQAGGNVSLYFGEVMWEGSQLYLLLSHDTSPQISPGDSIYTPRFSVYDVTNTTTPKSYISDSGDWLVGSNWINGSIPLNIPVGNYSIKAFDEVTANVAVTDTYITVYTVVYDSTLEISPSSGPGGVPVQFTGSNYPPNSPVTISYFDPAFGSWNPWATTNSNQLGNILIDSEIPDLRKSVGIGDYSETYTPVSYRTEISGIIYSYADYNQYSRGLKRVGDQIAYGLYGNGTNLAYDVKVEVGDTIPISGKWFHPNDVVYIKWDGVAVVGTVTGDEWRNATIIGSSIASSTGYFETNVTIPNASAGEHYLSVEDSQTRVIVKILVSQGSLQIYPPSGPGGVNVQFTGSGFPASSFVDVYYQDPNFGSWNYWETATANASGYIAFTAEIPDLRHSLPGGDCYESYTPISFRAEISGFVYCYVDYNQYSRGLKRIGNQIATGLYGNGTNLSSPNQTIAVKAKPGDAITLSGRWFNPGVVYVRWDGVNVVGTVTGDQWRNAAVIGTSIAGSTGSFETTVTIPTANVGEHYLAVEDSEAMVIVRIYVEAAPTPSPTPTPQATPTPTPAPTPSPPQTTSTIDVSCKGTTTAIGFKVEINGKLSSNGAPISGESVLISYSVTGGNSWESLTSVNTGSDGGFTAVWTPSVTGNYLIKAIWQGNSTFKEASTTVNLALTPCSEETVFSVTSNSTISEFAFNSTSKELSFTVSGPSNSKGYVNVYIPKSLINDVSDLKIYVDENLVTYSSESQLDSWLVSFEYSHSAHKVIIKLIAASSNPDETPLDNIIYVVIAAAAIAVAVVAAGIVFKRKRASKKN